jgi:hypothetical protein
LSRDFLADAEEAVDVALFTPYGRVGEGEVRFLPKPIALYPQLDVVHLDGLATIGLLDDLNQVISNFLPDPKEIPPDC